MTNIEQLREVLNVIADLTQNDTNMRIMNTAIYHRLSYIRPYEIRNYRY